MSITRGPAPTPEEVVAIVAAVQTVMSSGAGSGTDSPQGPPRWRFSGRWWSRPVPSRRERPFAF